MSAIRTLIDTLRIPSLQTRVCPLLRFFLLTDKLPGNRVGYVFWPLEYQTTRLVSNFHRRPSSDQWASRLMIRYPHLFIVVYRKSRQPRTSQPEPKETENSQKPQASLKLTDQYIALLIRIFTSSGLLTVCFSFCPIFSLHLSMNLQALSGMCEESITGTNLSRKATLLMAEILHIANKVLPLSVAAKIQVRMKRQLHRGLDANFFFTTRLFLKYSTSLLIMRTANTESSGLQLFLRLTVSIEIGRSCNLQMSKIRDPGLLSFRFTTTCNSKLLIKG